MQNEIIAQNSTHQVIRYYPTEDETMTLYYTIQDKVTGRIVATEGSAWSIAEWIEAHPED